MKAVSPVMPGREIAERKIAEHQDEFQTLPVIDLPGGIVLARFTLDEAEKKFVADKGFIYLYIWQGDQPLRPVFPMAEHPELESIGTEAISKSFDDRRPADQTPPLENVGYDSSDYVKTTRDPGGEVEVEEVRDVRKNIVHSTPVGDVEVEEIQVTEETIAS